MGKKKDALDKILDMDNDKLVPRILIAGIISLLILRVIQLWIL